MNDIIYKTDNCPNCVVLETQLANKRVSIRTVNIDHDPAARADFLRTGSRGSPTAVINGQVYVGTTSILQAVRAKYGR